SEEVSDRASKNRPARNTALALPVRRGHIAQKAQQQRSREPEKNLSKHRRASSVYRGPFDNELIAGAANGANQAGPAPEFFAQVTDVNIDRPVEGCCLPLVKSLHQFVAG